MYIYIKNVKKTYINIYIKVKKDSKKFGSINMKGGENWSQRYEYVIRE